MANTYLDNALALLRSGTSGVVITTQTPIGGSWDASNIYFYAGEDEGDYVHGGLYSYSYTTHDWELECKFPGSIAATVDETNKFLNIE